MSESNGFNNDFFDKNQVPNLSDDQPTDNGYTVTPNGGFYSNPNVNYPTVENKPPKKEKREKRYGKGAILFSILLSTIVSVLCSALLIISLTPKKTVVKEGKTEYVDRTSGETVNITVEETAQSVAEAVAKKATDCVVGIRTTTSVMNFFGGSQEASGDGSGVIYTEDGYIITNYHVIADAVSYSSSSKIEVYLETLDAEPYAASVVGYNISADLAVIKIEETELSAVEFADSSELKIGQYVITIGNPGGLEFMDSVTYGIISGLDRVVSSDSSVALIQTDAAINPGNSGGALLDSTGKLVGINSSKIASVEFEGMGFAIPSNDVKRICDDIISSENEPQPYVGITISEKYSSEVLQYYGFPSGAVVLSVAEGSPAEKSGIKKGDIITEFNGVKITEYHLFAEALKECDPGDNVDIKIYRAGRYYTAKILVISNN